MTNITGNNTSETLTGGTGNDSIVANGGNDLIYGAAGNDTIYGGTGNDTIHIDPGFGSDSIIGGEDTTGADKDVLDFYTTSNVTLTFTGNEAGTFSGSGTSETTSTFSQIEDFWMGWGNDYVDATLSNASQTLRGYEGNDTLIGGSAADSLLGENGNDSVSGGAGNDTVDGGAGNDTVLGGSGNDSLIGGSGTDLLSYSDATSGVSVNLGTSVTGGGAAGDTITGFENLAGSNSADTLTGDGNANAIYGGAGADSLFGGGGVDSLYGGTENDTLSGGAGGDSLDGGSGTDTADYSASTGGVAVDLSAGTGSGGDAAGDTLTGIENVVGSGQADTLTGDTGANALYGGAGADSLSGGGGADSLYGGTENDTLSGGAGGDSLDGGSGTDTADYSASTGGVAVDLSAGTGSGGDAAGDTLTGIENVLGSGQADTLTGDTGANALYGGTGADHLDGGGGADALYGGTDADTILGGIGDTADGGEGTNDHDVLDLSAYGWSLTDVTYDPSNPENGTVTFYDSLGHTIGSMSFSHIERVLVCFTPGTRITTDRGEIAVEALREGDRVFTRDNGYQPLRWIGQRQLSLADLMVHPTLRPIRIDKGALGEGLPERAMKVSPQHRMLFAGPRAEMLFNEPEVLVAATHLTHLPGIEQVMTPGVTYIHLLFDGHEIIRADGAWTESFQPAQRTLDAMGAEARAEIEALFPGIGARAQAFLAARPTLKPHEARVLLSA